MSEIKSFLQWCSNRESEYHDRLRKAFDSLCKDEIEMVHQAMDISLDYQDDGAKFEFLIVIGRCEGDYIWGQNLYIYHNNNTLFIPSTLYSADRTMSIYEDYLSKCERGECAPYLKINGDHISRIQISEFHKRIRSAFPDWKISLSSSPWRDDENGEFCMVIYRM